MNWYFNITQNLGLLPDFIQHFQDELGKARVETKIHGQIEKQLSTLPAIVETRFNQLQVIEAVLSYLNIKLRKTRSDVFKKYLEGYNRALSSRDCEKYVDGHDDVIDLETLVNEVALIRNQYLGIIKSLDNKQWQLTNIVKLKCAGLEDYYIS
jgi:hypothetical protein